MFVLLGVIKFMLPGLAWPPFPLAPDGRHLNLTSEKLLSKQHGRYSMPGSRGWELRA